MSSFCRHSLQLSLLADLHVRLYWKTCGHGDTAQHACLVLRQLGWRRYSLAETHTTPFLRRALLTLSYYKKVDIEQLAKEKGHTRLLQWFQVRLGPDIVTCRQYAALACGCSLCETDPRRLELLTDDKSSKLPACFSADQYSICRVSCSSCRRSVTQSSVSFCLFS